MAHCKKATRGAMGHLMKHYERSKDENGEYIKFGNLQIDSSRTHLNYNLAPEHDQLDFMQNRLKEVSVLNRKDVNVMCSWVVTAPKELPEAYHKEFFERTYDFLKNRYSPDEKNIISAYVHLDEATPHMHFAFIPVTYDPKKGREKVSAKEVINRADLNTFHRDLQEEMDRFSKDYNYEFECSILNGATAGGNKTIQELKTELLKDLNEQEAEHLNKLMACVSKQQGSLERVEHNNKMLLKRHRRLQNEILGLQSDKDSLGHSIDDFEVKWSALSDNEKILSQLFINSPKIKPMFDKFCSVYKQYLQDQQEKRKSVRASLSNYQKKAKDIDANSPPQNREHNKYPGHFER